MSVTCRNQGMALPERACGYHHEGLCPWERFIILRRPDFEALHEEWALADDPFFRPLKLVEVEFPAPERCPTCGSDDRNVHLYPCSLSTATSDWHGSAVTNNPTEDS